MNSAAAAPDLPSRERGSACISEKHFTSSATVANAVYVNQGGLNSCMGRARRHQSATSTSRQFFFPQYHFWCFHTASLLSSFLWRLEIRSQRDANLPTSSPHLQTQIAPGRSQAFLYAEPVTGVTHHSPPVTNCSLPNKPGASLALGCMCEAV